MAKRQNKTSEARKAAIQKGGMALGPHGGSGVLDPTTLPKPTLPAWGGWKGVKHGE